MNGFRKKLLIFRSEKLIQTDETYLLFDIRIVNKYNAPSSQITIFETSDIMDGRLELKNEIEADTNRYGMYKVGTYLGTRYLPTVGNR